MSLRINHCLNLTPPQAGKQLTARPIPGVLPSADCSDPLKLVLFPYPDFARVQTLNNKLSLESVGGNCDRWEFIYPAL
jgi:hypothetical protein